MVPGVGWRLLLAGVLAVVVIGIAIFALRAELAGPVERFVPLEIRHQAAQLAEQAGAALDSLLRSLRSAYNL